MPNRIIKESICYSESIKGLSWFEEVFFYRLIVNADDYGRLDGRSELLHARLFPLKRDITLATVERVLQKLVAAGMLLAYHHDGGRYLQLTAWEDHQHVRAKRSKFPPPPGDDSGCMQTQADAPGIQSVSESESISETEAVSETGAAPAGAEGEGALVEGGKKQFAGDGVEMELARELFGLMRQNNPGCREPCFQAWCAQVDLMLRVDKRTPDEVRALIRFSQADGFWRGNILSPGALRRQFDRLTIKAKAIVPEGGARGAAAPPRRSNEELAAELFGRGEADDRSGDGAAYLGAGAGVPQPPER